jgi:tyrosyl-tRNA synthetase
VSSACHGEEAASEAYLSSLKAFGPSDPDSAVKTSSNITKYGGSSSGPQDLPSEPLPLSTLEALDMAGLFALAGLASSKGEARRLIRQGGAYLDEIQIPATDEMRPLKGLPWARPGGSATLRAGKKRYKAIKVEP